MNEWPTTLIGLVGLAASLIIADWIKNRGKAQREDTKVVELSTQTQLMGKQIELLQSIRDGQDYDSEKNKKARRRIKVMAIQVKALHDKHIKPSSNQ